MKRYARFVAVGSVFATVEEFLTIVILKHDVGSYIFSLVVLFPVFLSFVYGSARLLGRMSRTEAQRELVHFFAYGWAGLMIEWYLIGLSPWSNPDANPLLMLVFQLGMFSFWATVAFVPRLFLSSTGADRQCFRSVARFYGAWFGCVYVIGLAAPEHLRFAVVIPLVIAGLLVLDLLYARHFLRAFARS
jgi:hypothetical protein